MATSFWYLVFVIVIGENPFSAGYVKMEAALLRLF